MNSPTKKKKILVVAHDAGGAEIIAAYVAAHTKLFDFRCFVSGPAARIFKRRRLPYRRTYEGARHAQRLIDANLDVDFALLGAPGAWMTDIERSTFNAARERGVRTVVYLDWWLDYRRMFGYPKRNWQKDLPDELWVGDAYAFARAKRYFGTKAKLVPNEYFADLVRRYRAAPAASRDVLFLTNTLYAEIRPALEATLRALCLSRSKTLRIRFHPAEKRGRYASLLQRYPKVRVEVSKEEDIVKDLVRSLVVVGTETTAMAAAVLSGIPTISLLPKGRTLSLPFTEIIRLVQPRKQSAAFDARLAGYLERGYHRAI